MKAKASQSRQSGSSFLPHSGNIPNHGRGGYQRAHDERKRPIRGLWIRNGRYYAQLSVEDFETGQKKTRRVPLEGCKTAAQAKAELEKLKVKREARDLPSLKHAPKFKDYVESYFRYLAVVKDAKRPATVAKERTTLNGWVKHLGERRLHQINRSHINSYIAKRQGSGLSARTCNIDVIILRNVLKRAIDDGWIQRLPTENMRPLKVTTEKRALVTAEEFEGLFQAAMKISKNGQQFCDYFRLMCFCGSRRDETLRLKWGDVDFELEQLTIGADGLAKNGEVRTVDFNAKLRYHLLDMGSRRAPDSDWVFPSPQRGIRDQRAKTFRETLMAASLESGVKAGCHDCRHFFISMCVMSGIDYMTIARWVGHRDGGILIGKVYGHLSNEHSRLQASRLSF